MQPQDHSQPSSNLPSFAEALAAANKMQQDWLEYGVNFVDRYVEDVDGDWLDQWGDDAPTENGSVLSDSVLSQRLIDHNSFIQSVVTFLMSDDPVAIEARPFWEDRPLPEIAVYLERCLVLPEVDRLYAVQNLLTGSDTNGSKRNFNNAIKQIDTLKLAKNMLEKLIQVQQGFSYKK
ncbi:MAG: hypothetical protein KME27_09300 [Lyngbya sp. HA4199-MV5]|jgi:hypothetical protein|nr:hypothetical protein [Lyngbya sp. HA4199-MV5]